MVGLVIHISSMLLEFLLRVAGSLCALLCRLLLALLELLLALVCLCTPPAEPAGPSGLCLVLSLVSLGARVLVQILGRAACAGQAFLGGGLGGVVVCLCVGGDFVCAGVGFVDDAVAGLLGVFEAAAYGAARGGEAVLACGLIIVSAVVLFF